MNCQTWVITFHNPSAADASQDTAELEEFLQDTFRGTDIIITRERSKDYTQNLWDRIIAILNTNAAAAFLGKIATFLKRKPRLYSNLTIEVREGTTLLLKAENLTDESFQRMLDQWSPIIKEMIDKNK